MRSLCIFEKCRGAEPPVELFLEDVTKKQIVVFLILAPHKLEEKKSDRQQIGVSNSLDFYGIQPLLMCYLCVQKQTRTGSNFYLHCHRDGNRVKNIILTYLPLASAICVYCQFQKICFVVSYSIADSGGNGDFGREMEIFGRKIAPSPPGRAVVLSSDLLTQ